jgi:type VII secretion-associated serine protease mycosin
MLSRRARLAVPGLALAGITVLTGAAAQGPDSVAAQVRAAEQPQLQAVEAPAAWRLSQGRGVTVAVLDTGVDATAADLAGSVTTGPDYTLGADPPGYQPPHLHGTFIASLIAGHGSGPSDDGGIIGVAPAARVLSVRVILDDQEPGLGVYNSNPRYADAIDDGIRYATQHGAQVINMSLGTGDATRGMQAALGYAVSHGVLVVASAGNSGRPGPGYTPYSYPAAFTGVVSVAAVDQAGQRASFSDQNSSVELSAPGVSIIGAGPGGDYLQASGTSPASAFVAGVAALIRSAYPRLSPAQVAQALISSARRRPAGGYSPSTGFGEVDAVAALHAAGRLAAARPAAGLAARGHFATAPGPVQVTHRDPARIAVLAGVAAAGAAGMIIALVALTLLTARTARDRRRLAAVGPAVPAARYGAGALASMRNVGLIELLEPADPGRAGTAELAAPADPAEPGRISPESAAGPDRPASMDRPASTEPESGTETGP